MINKSISDFVASKMDEVLKSAEHQSIFGSDTYKFATHMCEKCHKPDSECTCVDTSKADDNFAKTHKQEKTEEEEGKRRSKEEKDSYDKDSDENDAFDKPTGAITREEFNLLSDDEKYNLLKRYGLDKDDNTWSELAVYDEPSSEEEDGEEYYAGPGNHDLDDTYRNHDLDDTYNAAIDGLLTASAALDKVGMVNGATLSLKIASLVVEAKKKEEKKSKDSKKKNSKKEKDSKDSKKEKDSKSSKDSVKSKSTKDTKSSKKTSFPFQKKK